MSKSKEFDRIKDLILSYDFLDLKIHEESDHMVKFFNKEGLHVNITIQSDISNFNVVKMEVIRAINNLITIRGEKNYVQFRLFSPYTDSIIKSSFKQSSYVRSRLRDITINSVLQ